MKMSVSEYTELYNRESPKSPWARNMAQAFLVGGGFCLAGEGLTQLFLRLGTEELRASALTSLALILLSALLTGLGLYERLARFAGAGSLVPITGFANAMTACAIEFKKEGYVLGVGAKMFAITGPVIVYGTAASVVYGMIYWICKMITGG